MEDSPDDALSGCLSRTLVTELDLSSHTQNTLLTNLLFTKNNQTRGFSSYLSARRFRFDGCKYTQPKLKKKQRTRWGADNLIIMIMVVGNFYNPSKHFQAKSEYKTLHLLTTNDNKPVFVQTSGHRFLLFFLLYLGVGL